MKIKLSKSQWEGIGKQAGWMKKAQNDGDNAEGGSLVSGQIDIDPGLINDVKKNAPQQGGSLVSGQMDIDPDFINEVRKNAPEQLKSYEETKRRILEDGGTITNERIENGSVRIKAKMPNKNREI